ncbi:LuxR family transcriptional regulator [Rhizobium sp. S152]|uniref:LuxR family transcriptional regulator n=1 Tax=Rhizobium sp. S152 TaxID=3055038 RepID=UPI0025A97440|nr:LuxR family transcriptional regulator [Rhizobium sp. S152]MDM9624402.1 LuxR family transcriptional regulator [Rhizobium sp. S152]
MNIHYLIQLLVVLEGCRKVSAVEEELAHVAQLCGFDYFALTQYSKDTGEAAGILLAGKMPETWLQIYKAKKYAVMDPAVRYLAHAQKPFRWRDGLAAFRKDPHHRRMEIVIADAQAHGLRDGYTFPIQGRKGILGSLVLAGNTVDLSPVEISLFDAVSRKAFWRVLEINGSGQPIDSVLGIDARLTRREMEILQYLAEGMTSVEIGKLLKISNHTVDWYMNGLQDKLKAKNRQHAVAIAFRHGLII